MEITVFCCQKRLRYTLPQHFTFMPYTKKCWTVICHKLQIMLLPLTSGLRVNEGGSERGQSSSMWTSHP